MLLGSESSAEIVSPLSFSPLFLSSLLCDLALAIHNISESKAQLCCQFIIQSVLRSGINAYPTKLTFQLSGMRIPGDQGDHGDHDDEWHRCRPEDAFCAYAYNEVILDSWRDGGWNRAPMVAAVAVAFDASEQALALAREVHAAALSDNPSTPFLFYDKHASDGQPFYLPDQHGHSHPRPPGSPPSPPSLPPPPPRFALADRLALKRTCRGYDQSKCTSPNANGGFDCYNPQWSNEPPSCRDGYRGVELGMETGWLYACCPP
jgi:hypothetical protein